MTKKEGKKNINLEERFVATSDNKTKDKVLESQKPMSTNIKHKPKKVTSEARNIISARYEKEKQDELNDNITDKNDANYRKNGPVVIENNLAAINMIMNSKEKNNKQHISNFAFNAENLVKINKIISQYPSDRKQSAIIAALDLAQRQNGGHINKDAISYIAHFLEMEEISVYEVASFYTMFNLEEVGKYHIQICSTTPCWLRGSSDITKAFEERLGIRLGETTTDQKFTISEVECLGACVCAPVVQINDDYYENLSNEEVEEIINDLSKK